MIQHQIITPQTVYIQYETTNSSFIEMHRYLKAIGIKNNNFFLVLYDRDLAGVDPRDINLSYQMKSRIFRECCANYWYFIREVVRIPTEGAGTTGVRYKMHRGNLAMNFLFSMNYSQFTILPRQNFKTVSTAVRYLWVFNFGASYSTMGFFHKDHGGSKGNLKTVKELRDALPSYLQMSAETNTKTGQKLKVPNTVIALGHKVNGNSIITYPSARSENQADKLGRGATIAILYFDEFAFMPYNRTVFTAAMPAYSKAADNAKRFHSPYGVCITTTPGDLITDEGKYAHEIMTNSIPWAERYYDLDYQGLEKLRKSNTNTPFFVVQYSYQQLGRGEEYFKEMVVYLTRDWAKVRREVLLEWTTVTENGAFTKEDLDKIKQYCRDPIRTLFFGKAMQYQFHVYEDIDLRWPPVIGVDVSGANYNDSSTITVVDSRTTKVTACLNSNYMPGDDLADVIYTLVTKYMNNAVVNCERNGGFGSSVIARLTKTSIKKNLYYEIKDKTIEESFDGVRVSKRKAKVRVYGLDSTKSVRADLIDLLYERVRYHKDKFISPIILHELETMQVKQRTGKVEHADGAHDDQVFSYLMAMHVLYHGNNIMENWGIQRNVIKTDEDKEIEESLIESEENVELLDPSIFEVKEEPNTPEDIIKDKFFEANKNIKLENQFKAEMLADEEEELNIMLASDPKMQEAYRKKYNVMPSALIQSNITTIPESVFIDFNGDDQEAQMETIRKRNGNLYDIFSTL